MSGAVVLPEDWRDEVADFVVIGSGAAGGTAARVLAGAGLDVVLLEEGPPPDRARVARGIFPAMAHLFRDLGMTVMTGRSAIPYLQGRCLGGSTAINSAICWRMPEDVYARCWAHHGLERALPLSELDDAYRTLEEELSVGPVREDRLGNNNRLMRRACEELGWRGRTIERNERDCEGSGQCLQACPTQRKQSVDVTYIPQALRDGARVYPWCEVQRIGVADGRAAWVDARGSDQMARARRLRVRARRGVILAASAVQTPCLLRRSGLGDPRHVGEHFRAHPGAAMIGVFDAPVRHWQGATQGYESDAFRRQGIKFEAISLPFPLGGVRIPGVGDAFSRAAADWDRMAIWAVQVRAEAEGRVRPGWFGPRVSYTPAPGDMARLRRGLAILAEMLFAAGARAVLPGIHGLPERIEHPDRARRLIRHGPLDPRAYKMIATHLFGTARMSLDPASGVVGPDFQVHRLPGLFVVDSSVFPANLGVNPQHTIMAVAMVAARRLAAAI